MDNSRWVQLSPYLDQALELAPEQRDGWLAALHLQNPSIAVEIRVLLKERDQLHQQQFLAHDVYGTLRHEVAAGQTIGAYTVLELLGRGGMGSVWLARRSDGRFEGNVAIKLLNRALPDNESEPRFRREGNVLARLNHPNIARLLDAGLTDDLQPYLVIEYVAGLRIDAYCDAHQQPVDARIRLFLDVLAAVVHAHAKLIVHRDIKPSNIYVSDDGVVKLLDFGIAKLLESDAEAGGDDAADLTREGRTALTPEYAAPEQMLGGEITTASDVYALGVLLYVLLSGRHPTHGEGMAPAERVRTLLETEPARLSEMPAGSATNSQAARRNSTPERLQRTLRGDLENIVAKALRKQQSERYITVAALAEDLRSYLAREPVSARPDSFTYRSRLFVRRHRLGVGAATATFLALVVGVIGTTWQAVEASRQRDAAHFEAARAEASSQFMSLMLEEVGPGDRPPTLTELLDRAQDLLDKQYGGDPRFVSTMLVELARRYLDMGRNDKALSTLARATSIAQTLGDDALLARSLCASAYTRFMTSKPDLAQPELERATAALGRLRNPSVELRVDCLRAQADQALHNKDQARALALLKSAHELHERSGDTRGLQYTSVLVDMGGIYLRSGRLPEAYATSLQVTEAFDRNGRSGTMGKVTSEANLAVILNYMGEVLAASRLQQNVIQRVAALQASDSSRVAYAVNYAGSLTRLGHPEAALVLLQQLSKKALDENGDFWMGGYEFQYARALFAQGDAAGAEPHMQEVERLWQKDTTRNASSLRGMAVQRVRMELQTGETEVARQRVDALLRELQYPQERTGAAVRNALIVAAAVYLQAGQTQQADDYAAAAYDIGRQVARIADESADVGEAAYLRARTQQALGHTEAAKSLLKQAVKSLGNGLGKEHALTREAADAAAELGG